MSKAAMATKYYRGNNSDWNTDAEWSTTSGGAADTTFPTAADDAIFDANSGNCILDANAACLSLTIGTNGSLYTGTIDAATHDVAIGAGGLDCAYGGGVLDLGTGTHTCAGDWNMAAIGTLTRGTATVDLTGASKVLTGKSGDAAYIGTIRILTISGIYNVATTASAKYLTVSGTATADGAVILGTAGGGWCKVTNTGTITGTGALWIPGAFGGGITQMDGTIDVALLYLIQAASIVAATYDSALVKIAVGTTATNQFESGAYVFSGNFELESDGAGDLTLDLATNDPTVTIVGDLIFDANGAGDLVISPGANGFIVHGGIVNQLSSTGVVVPNNCPLILTGSAAQSIDGCGGAWGELYISKPVAGTVTFTGPWVVTEFTCRDGNLNLNGQTVTVTNAATFSSGFTVADPAGVTINCDTVSFDGQDFSAASGGWDIVASTSGTATGTTFRNCTFTGPGGVKLDATDPTNVDDGGNNGIDFGGNRRRRLLMACGA